MFNHQNHNIKRIMIAYYKRDINYNVCNFNVHIILGFRSEKFGWTTWEVRLD